MADQQPSADITQRVTSPTPATKPATEKNPKRVAAGKAVAEKTRKAREAQKKASEELASIKAASTTSAPAPASTTKDTSAPAAEPSGHNLTANQLIAAGSICVSLLGLYYKREELKAAFKKEKPAPPATDTFEQAPEQPKRELRRME